jgi:hypothetical protein
MKGISQVVLFLGFILISSIARAGAPDAVEATQEPTKKFSFLSPELLSIRFADPGPETPYLASTGSFNLPLNEDFGKIVIMPKFIVMTRRNLPVEREMLTDYGRVQFAKKIFTTPLYRATFGPLSQIATYYFNFLSILNGWHPNDAEAMTLYRESERVRILSEFDDLSRLEGLGDPHAGAEFIRMRSEVWRTGFNSLYWDPFAGAAGFHVTLRKR